MSAAILDRARAFSMIAEHLPEAERKRVAEAIAGQLAPKAAARPVPLFGPEPIEAVRPESSDVAVFLAAHGYERKSLCDATVQLTRWLDAHRGVYMRAAGMRVWLRQQEGAA